MYPGLNGATYCWFWDMTVQRKKPVICSSPGAKEKMDEPETWNCGNQWHCLGQN